MSALLSIALFRRVGQVSNSFHFNGKIFNGAIVNNLNSFHTTKFTQGFDEFQDPVKEDSIEFITGRAWTPADLRRKSFDDLHKLWFVLYKERNLLLTSKSKSRKLSNPFIGKQEGRYIKVKRSMAAIKFVLDERKKIQDYLALEQKNKTPPSSA